MNLFNFFSEMSNTEETFWIIDMILVFALLTVVLLTLKSCLIRSIVNRFIYFFYGAGFILFVSTYFLFRETEYTDDDGTIAIAAFIVIVCLVMVKRMKDSNARKEYP